MPTIWPPKVPTSFPLTITERGYIKKIRGKTYWIASKNVEPAEALRIYHRKANAILGNQQPLPEPKPPAGDNPTLQEILARWVHDRRLDAERGELRGSTWVQYKLSAKRLADICGHYLAGDWTPDMTKGVYDKLAKQYSLDWAKRAMGHLRAACNHARDMGWCRDIRLGKNVVAKLASRPPARMKWRLYTIAEIQRIVAEAKRQAETCDGRSRASMQQLYAMILLALNGGYGAKELSDLPTAVVDLERRRIDYNRIKTDATHIVPLWDETIEALKVVMAQRPGDPLLFRTRQGNPWVTDKHVYRNGRLVKTSKTDNVSERFNAFVDPLGLKFEGQGFYKLKHLHCTTADKGKDPHATFALSGHSLPGERSPYVAVGEDRLRELVEFIRDHLLNPARAASPHPGPQPGSPAPSGDTAQGSSETLAGASTV